MTKMIKSTIRTIFHQMGRVPPISTVSRRWQGSAAILGYHRVIPDPDYSLLNGPYKDLSCCITTFEDQLKFLRSNYCLVSMNQLFKHIREKRSGFVVAITMDDGYRDNYLYALPVLERLDIPVTIYVTTRFLEGDTSMWWFDLWDELYVRDSVVSVVGDVGKYFKTKSMRQKVSAYEKLKKVAMQLSETDLWVWLEKVKNNKQRRQYPNLVCDSDLLSRLCSNRLITIGCHSHSHCVLSLCTDSELREELSLSKHILEEKLSTEVGHLAYPYGGKVHAGDREYKAAMKCGFRSAVTTIPKKIDGDSLYCLGRHLPHSFTLNDHLRNKLEGWNNLFGLPV